MTQPMTEASTSSHSVDTTADLGVLTPLSKPILYLPTAENKITCTHISISITNRAEKSNPTPI